MKITAEICYRTAALIPRYRQPDYVDALMHSDLCIVQADDVDFVAALGERLCMTFNASVLDVVGIGYN
jgi:hypothetical protein